MAQGGGTVVFLNRIQQMLRVLRKSNHLLHGGLQLGI
jgi:hypothetical protein